VISVAHGNQDLQAFEGNLTTKLQYTN